MVPSHEIYLPGSWLPLSWKQYDADENNNNNNNNAAILEMTCDVITNAVLRQISSLTKRYCEHVTLDISFLLHNNEDNDNDDNKEDEYYVCLELLQMGNVQLKTCPIIPVLTERMSLRHASKI